VARGRWGGTAAGDQGGGGPRGDTFRKAAGPTRLRTFDRGFVQPGNVKNAGAASASTNISNPINLSAPSRPRVLYIPLGCLRQLPSGAAALALSHNPDTADLPGWDAYSGWILAGHTHGGQCKPPFLPPPLLPVQNRRYSAGEFALSGGRRLYISRGLGHLLTVRFNVRPEITMFRLERA
jgi:predicted MPP superfamily phosphohydrolase